jgi:hypothetical protein
LETCCLPKGAGKAVFNTVENVAPLVVRHGIRDKSMSRRFTSRGFVGHARNSTGQLETGFQLHKRLPLSAKSHDNQRRIRFWVATAKR